MFWPKRSSGGKRRAKPDFSKVLEADEPAKPSESGEPRTTPTPQPATRRERAPKPDAIAAADERRERRRAKKLTKPARQPAKPKKPFTLVMGTGSLISIGALMALLLAWGVAMTLVLIFGDKMSTRLIAQNSEMQDAYEQRLQAYRDEIARVVSEAEQSKVDKDSVTGRVIELTRRQRILETRQNIINRLADQIGGADPNAASGSGSPPAGAEPPAPPPRPGFPTRATQPSQTRGDADVSRTIERADIGEKPTIARPVQMASADAQSVERFAQFFEAPTIESGPTQTEIELEAQVGRLERALVQLEAQQTRSLNGIARMSDVRIDRFRNALNILGLTPEQLAPETGRPVALPALVIPLSEQTTPFGLRISQIRGNVSLLARLQPVLKTMPMDRPTAGYRLASPFGMRVHPISNVQRLHAGLDMAAPLGTPVRAAGSGVVLSAGWGGGYGNLVQIDHGRGVISRYAHLSSIEVAQGQPIAAGALVGLMGSTGASTGSHLHFETRIRGTPHNPACFLLAGDRIQSAANAGFVCDKPPFQQNTPDKQEDEDDDR